MEESTETKMLTNIQTRGTQKSLQEHEKREKKRKLFDAVDDYSYVHNFQLQKYLKTNDDKKEKDNSEYK